MARAAVPPAFESAAAWVLAVAALFFGLGLLLPVLAALPDGHAATKLGLALGLVGPALGHPYRRLGLIPLGLTALAAGLAAWPWLPPAGWVAGVAAALAGLPIGPLVLGGEGWRWPWPRWAVPLAVALSPLVLAGSAVAEGVELDAPALAGFVAAAALPAWAGFLRPALELTIATLSGPLYRIRVVGPGKGRCPLTGPVLVIANHAAYLDPFWLGKVLPRRLVPLMTSTFYDKPIIHWLMRRVVRAIRVPDLRFRHAAPELAETVARLDAGACVIIFPEGGLRRKDEEPLRRFGQGIWHVLRDRPATPILPCWIEGGWGSFFSCRGGPPGANKPFDWFRRITVVIGEPFTLGPPIPEDHQPVRQQLFDRVLALRKAAAGAAAAAGPAPPR